MDDQQEPSDEHIVLTTVLSDRPARRRDREQDNQAEPARDRRNGQHETEVPSEDRQLVSASTREDHREGDTEDRAEGQTTQHADVITSGWARGLSAGKCPVRRAVQAAWNWRRVGLSGSTVTVSLLLRSSVRRSVGASAHKTARFRDRGLDDQRSARLRTARAAW